MNERPRSPVPALVAICLLFATVSSVGITWGLPSRDIDKFLFGGAEPWPGEKIYRLAGAAEKFSPSRGADVDVDPLAKAGDELVLLTGTDADVARILLRYRLYTHQPDEMITMMALAGMRPGKLQFDPRLYQYGGLFIYPVGALIKLSGLLGLIEVRSDVAYYLDNPEEFGKFYVVARAYAAAWGLIGVLVVFAIARRLAGDRAGLTAALLITLMPVVICMAHEGKPHLPGAVLMLLAVWFAMRHLDPRAAGFSLRDATTRAAGFSPREATGREGATSPITTPVIAGLARDWWLMCLCCGAAFGMVLSSLPIFILIPLVAWLGERWRPTPIDGSGRDAVSASPVRRAITHALTGLVVASVVYLVTNPYIVFNAFTNREVLRSNFGNSLAMYEIARVSEGFTRVLELTIEGATLIVMGLGIFMFIVAAAARNRQVLPLAIAALVFFVQFVLIGAGKPAEYGRFGVFTNSALVIAAAMCVSGAQSTREHWLQRAVILLMALLVGFHGTAYLWNFHADAGNANTRIRLARDLTEWQVTHDKERPTLLVNAEPAPYCCPPMRFAAIDMYLDDRVEYRSTVDSERSRRLKPAARDGWTRTDGDLVRNPSSAVLPTRDTVLVRPVDASARKAPQTPAMFRVSPKADGPHGGPYDSASPGPTPISWANKPFEVIRVGGPDE